MQSCRTAPLCPFKGPFKVPSVLHSGASSAVRFSSLPPCPPGGLIQSPLSSPALLSQGAPFKGAKRRADPAPSFLPLVCTGAILKHQRPSPRRRTCRCPCSRGSVCPPVCTPVGVCLRHEGASPHAASAQVPQDQNGGSLSAANAALLVELVRGLGPPSQAALACSQGTPGF